MACESCRKQLFPYLYDLLETAERHEVERHLRDCADCQAELEHAKAQRADVALAVKSSFPDVVFAAPRATTTARPPKVVAARRLTPRRPLLLSRWAVAAAVVIAVLSSGAVVAWNITSFQSDEIVQAEERLAKAQASLKQVQTEVDAKQASYQKDVRAIQEEIDRLVEDVRKQEKAMLKVVKQQRVRFEVKGPRSVQPGAPNRFDVQVKQANPAQPAQLGQLRAQVINERTKEVVFEKHFAGAAQNQFILPPDLAVKPGDQLALRLEADADGVPAQVHTQLSLLFPEYVTHLSTDRPMYRPGEMVRFRSLTLERFSLRPATDELRLRYRILGPNQQELYKHDVATRLVDAKNKAPILGPDGQPLHGLGVGEFRLPRELPGGVYTLSVTDMNERFPEEKRTFVVHRWQAPRFAKEAEFDGKSYGPGEHVILRGKVTSLGEAAASRPGMPAANPGGAPMGVPPVFAGQGIHIRASAIADGMFLFNAEQNTGPDGNFAFEFTLPNVLPRGDGSVTLEFNDNGTIETLVRPIPIVLRDVLVDFYPEGGDLVAGVPNRVYFQARTGTSKPADIQGRVLELAARDKRGLALPGKENKEVARVQTLTDVQEPGINQGLGAFTFVPQADCRYVLQLDRPIGIAKTYPLPGAKASGVVLHLPQGVIEKEIPVTVQSVGKQRDLLIGAYCRGKLLDHTAVHAGAGAKTDVVLHPAADVGGVYRVTVFEKQAAAGGTGYTPVAERLLFRKQAAQVHVATRPDRAAYAPGDPVTLRLEARNEKQELAPAVAMVAVIDASVLKLVGEKTHRSMPTHFLLTTEVRRPEDLENADALLGDHPQAAHALDLLLGVQGWRRFAEQDPQKFAQRQTPGRPPGFLANTQRVDKVGVDVQQERDKFDKPFIGKFVALEEELAQKERAEAGSPELAQRLASAQQAVNHAHEQLADQGRRRSDLNSFLIQATFGTAAVGFVFFAFFLVSTGLYRLAEGKSGYILVGGGLGLLGVLFMVSVLGTFALMGSPHERLFMNNRRTFAAPPMAVPAPVMVQVDAGGGMPIPAPPNGPNDQALRMALEDRPDDEASGPEQDPQMFELPANPMHAGAMLPGNPPPFGGADNEAVLRQQGRYQEILQRRLGRKVDVPPPTDPSVVRVYAHQHRAGANQVRRDFTETLAWQPALVLPGGQAEIRFNLSDAVTHFRVLVVSHTLDGRLGADSTELISRLPFRIEPQVPVEVSASDQLVLPLAVRNTSTEDTTARVELRSQGLHQHGDAPGPLLVAAGASARHLFRCQPAVTAGKVVARFQGKFAKATDIVERSFNVVPDGFPIGGAFSGTLEGQAPLIHELAMPPTWVPGSLELKVQAFPSVVADLQEGAAAMLRAPHGCFEQSSSSTYPNILVLDYLQNTKQANPAIERQARALLGRGYEQLVGFECAVPGDPQARRGYEWFGGAAPPHEALSAYGLLEFHDMARVFPVDAAMQTRTRQYLLDQRDGKGGFKRNARAVDQFGRAPQDITNAYIVWALTETGIQDELRVEVDALYAQGKGSKDPYFIALAGISQLNAARSDRGVELLRRLRDFQKDTGEVAGARTSITSSAGHDLVVETTALSALGWMRAAGRAEFRVNAQNAGRWLLAQRRGAGGFGGTQATVLALKALIAFAQANPSALQPGEIQLEVLHDNMVHLAGKANLSPGAIEPVLIKFRERDAAGADEQPPAGFAPNFPNAPNGVGGNDLQPALVLAPGKNQLQVRLAGGNNRLPYTVSWSYRTLRPASADDCPVQLTTSLSQPRAQEGKTVKLKALVHNRSEQDQGMTVAVIGLPAGLTLPEDFRQLKELAQLRDNHSKPGVIGAWELRGRELVLYWRELKADATVAVDLDLVCRLPGVYRGPPSQAYLYYAADRKHWLEPLQITIDPAP